MQTDGESAAGIACFGRESTRSVSASRRLSSRIGGVSPDIRAAVFRGGRIIRRGSRNARASRRLRRDARAVAHDATRPTHVATGGTDSESTASRRIRCRVGDGAATRQLPGWHVVFKVA